MYLLKQDIQVDFENHRKIAERIGIHHCTLSKILNRKQSCSKKVAYAITKLNNSEEEIEKYFDYIDKDTTVFTVSCKNKELLNEISKKLGQDLNDTLEEVLLKIKEG